MLDEMTYQNISKFAIFLENENTVDRFLRFIQKHKSACILLGHFIKHKLLNSEEYICMYIYLFISY